jgi:hypothetical protein
MDQNPIPFQAAQDSLRTQIARVCVLARYLTEALDLQHVEPSLHEDVSADKLVMRMLGILRQQHAKLEEFARAIPEIQKDFMAPSVSMAGLFMKFISKRRPRQVSGMLRNDRMMLRLAMMNYRALYAIGTELGDTHVAELARAHLDQLVELGQELHGLAPADPEEAGDIPTEFAAGDTTGCNPVPC